MTKIAKRKLSKRGVSIAKVKALHRSGKLQIPKPSPLAAALFGAAVSTLRGNPIDRVIVDGLCAAVEKSNTVICPQCGTYALMANDEHAAGPCAKCGADMTHAKRATRDDVRVIAEQWRKPIKGELG